MQTQKSNVKFPWVAMAIAVVIAAAWGYTHRGKEDLVVTVPRQAPEAEAPEAEAPVAVQPPVSRETTRKLPAIPKEKMPVLSQEEETVRIHPLDEPDPEKDADPALVDERNQKEERLHAIQHGN